MKENIKEKSIVTKLNVTPIILESDINKFDKNNDIDTLESNNNSNIKNNIKFLTKKKEYFRTRRISNLNKTKINKSTFNIGRWKKEEKNQFLLGISLYG